MCTRDKHFMATADDKVLNISMLEMMHCIVDKVINQWQPVGWYSCAIAPMNGTAPN